MVASIQKPKSRKIVESDAIQIAKLVAESLLTEKEACLTAGIRPEQWYQWKLRNGNSQRFDTLFTQLKSARIQQAVQRINDCGDGIGLKQPDWRAKAFLLQVTDKRFRVNQQEATQQSGPTTVQVLVMSEAIKRAYAEPQMPLESILIAEVAQDTPGESKCPINDSRKSKIPPRRL